MNITPWSSSTTQTSTQASGKLDAVSAGIQKSGNKIQAQLDTATTSLSALGKFKAAVAEAQTAAKSLSALKDGARAEDVKKALGSLVEKFNAMVAASASVSTDSDGVARVSKALVRTMGADVAKISTLRNLGLSKGNDGRLTLDSAKLDAAYKASPSGVLGTLSKLGQLVDKVAGKELASEGSLSQTANSLTSKTSLLQQQRNVLLKVAQQYSSLQSS